MQRVLLSVSIVLLLVGYTNCMQNGFEVQGTTSVGSLGGTPLPTPTPSPTPNFFLGKNVVPVKVGSCGSMNYACVSVTICNPGTASCQIVANVLLSTASNGLRIFKQALDPSITFPPVVTADNKEVAECMPYASGSTMWGPVKYADVVLDSEKASKVPFQVVDGAYGTIPSSCTNNEVDTSKGYNGVLGVGVLPVDCGVGCAVAADNKIYFSCVGTTCAGATVLQTLQTANPIAMMPFDNNGVTISLPAVVATSPTPGAVSIEGKMYLGVGTQSDNMPGTFSVFKTDDAGGIKTKMNNVDMDIAIIDIGTTAYIFPSTLQICPNPAVKGLYCPTATAAFTPESAIMISADGSAQKTISFSIMNAESAILITNPNFVFPNLGGTYTFGTQTKKIFDWGLPFFLGRTVSVGIKGMSAPNLGVGPYFAY